MSIAAGKILKQARRKRSQIVYKSMRTFVVPHSLSIIEKTIIIPIKEVIIIMKAYKSEEYKKVLNSADMVVPDGIGVVYAAKILKKPVPERVAGFDLTCNMLKYAGENNISVYIT